MTRISLKEAYDNRDVIAQIARLNDIVEDLPNPDLTNVVLKTGNQIIDGVKQFNDQVILAGGMDLTALGPTTITGDLDISGDLQVDGDIIQTGAAYETHAEQVFSHNDYIVMRDGAVNSLPAGSYSGLQVKKYDGTNDCRLVVDNTGIARVGDVNDERPLLVRDEAADLASGDVLRWDSSDQKAVGSPISAIIGNAIMGRSPGLKIVSGFANNGTNSVTFPITFAANPALFLTAISPGTGRIYATNIKTISTTGFTFTNNYTVSGSNTWTEDLYSVFWIAIGTEA